VEECAGGSRVTNGKARRALAAPVRARVSLDGSTELFIAVGRFLERLSTVVTHQRWIRVIVAGSQRWKLTFCY
jgi:hypothetical protein